MSITRKIIVAISLIAVIPSLAIFYLLTNGSSAFFTTKSLIIFIIFFLIALGILGLHNLIRTLKKLCSSLETIARGDINHKAEAEPSSGITDLALSINQVSQRLRESADELEKRTILIERFNQQLKKTAEFSSEYFSNIVHELRAPLINIEKSSIVLLEHKTAPANADSDNLLKIINNSSKRMIRLISDLLDISKMEAGQLLIKRQRMDIKEVIDEAAVSVENWRKSKNLELKVRTSGNLPQIYADKDRIVQVIVNLLSNAIKFTPSGGKITVEAEVFSDEVRSLIGQKNNETFIEISVHDTGAGIPESKKDKIFDRFNAESSTPFATSPNTGLGLPIAKQIVQKHGGRIWAQSRPGEGTTVAFILPKGAEEDSKESATPPGEPAASR